MILTRFLLRNRPNINVSTCACKFYTITAKPKRQEHPRWFNQNWIRGFPTESKTVSRGAENGFAYKIVKNAGIPVFNKPQDSSIFEQVVNTNGSEQALEELEARVHQLSDTDLVSNLNDLAPLKESDYFTKVWKIVDDEGSKRVPNADPSVVLAGAMKIYEMEMTYRSEWVWSCLKRFCRRLDRLTKAEVLQVMFLVNIARKIPLHHSGFDVQYHLVGHFDNFDLDEMALVSVAFFKSETKMRNKVIMSKVMRKMIEEASTASGLTLAMLAKIIRYSLPLSLSDELYVVQSRLVEEITRVELKSLTHLALSGTNSLVYNKEFVGAIVQRIKENISKIRLKDIEKILFVMSLYNHRDEEFIQKVLNELEGREEEIVAFPRSLVCLLNYLAIMETFPFDWINRVFSKKFLYETYESSLKKLGTELIFLDKTVEIEKPEYSGNRLPTKILTQSAKITKFSVRNQLSGTQKFSFELEALVKQIYGDQNLTFMSLLPHYFFSEFVLGFDENLKPIPVPPHWAVHRWGEVKPLPDDKNIWFAIITGGWNTCVRNTEEPLGLLLTKLRQLRILGYHPIIYNAWRESTDKLKIVKETIDTELNRIHAQTRLRKVEG